MCSLTRCARSRDHPSPDHPSPDLPFLQFLKTAGPWVGNPFCVRSRDALAHAMRSLTRPSVPGPSVPGPTLLAILDLWREFLSHPSHQTLPILIVKFHQGFFICRSGARCPAHGLPFLSGTEINTQRNRQRVEHQHGAQKDNSGAIQRGFGSIRNLCGHCVQVH